MLLIGRVSHLYPCPSQVRLGWPPNMDLEPRLQIRIPVGYVRFLNFLSADHFVHSNENYNCETICYSESARVGTLTMLCGKQVFTIVLEFGYDDKREQLSGNTKPFFRCYFACLIIFSWGLPCDYICGIMLQFTRVSLDTIFPDHK